MPVIPESPQAYFMAVCRYSPDGAEHLSSLTNPCYILINASLSGHSSLVLDDILVGISPKMGAELSKFSSPLSQTPSKVLHKRPRPTQTEFPIT
ncbi:hypothetical protein DSO57_1034531 [Entomophthora muscae]|uniref:Uncharacterized protein n=1 Tax=Entomophthora muscae TaxID=34485 RepID=A0ACC2RQP7_9FUNG|nr:hypothetical protein DSO57_1034531 [Entomophthora muscae]